MTTTHALADIYTVDPQLMGEPGALSMYLIDAPKPVLVDTGTARSSDVVMDALETVGVDPSEVAVVLVTHVHLDHAGGAGHLAELLPNATFYIHDRGFSYLTEPDAFDRLKSSVDDAMGTENAYGEPKRLDPARCLSVSGGETVDIGDRSLELIDAPGHAPHHYAAFDPDNAALFSIDAGGMYLDGTLYPTTPPPSFDLEGSLNTIKRLRDLDPDRNLYGHFGPGGSDAVEELDRYEALLPEWVETVAEKRETHGEDIGAIVDSLDASWHSPTVARDVAGVIDYLDRR
jgi:glyoxylase-like metal-dependent hydrolase (beta-lactamase superfamily II)